MASAFAPVRGSSASDEHLDALDHEPLTLPDAWAPPPRPPLPLLASAMPIVGAVVLWLVTGSILALLLAALGPLIAVASVFDTRRANRRDRARAVADAADVRHRVARTVERRHAQERRRRRALHPDVAGFLSRDEDVWRRAPERADALVLGIGDVESDVRVTGGARDPDAAALRARASRLSGAPVVVGASTGCAVVGAGALAVAVHRAMVLQLCLALPPGELRIVGELPDELAWIDRLPHRHVARGRTLAVTGDPAEEGADIVVAISAPGAPTPAGCGALLEVRSPGRALLDHRGATVELGVEAVGLAQAEGIADELAERAARTLGVLPASDGPVLFSSTMSAAPASRRGALPAVIGRAGERDVVVDLVEDGPHAVVAGVTGSGKSELLITWILALAATHSTREVSFLLADFKGGTAFDGLRSLPHVTGVITDLDGAGARRAIESLRAEIRWREAELARAGARDLLDPRVELPRLVVVVDEFAALLGDHPELHAVFGDIAARGRALGLHLVLGTQRITGVVRDSLLANCPLRLSLRVTDPSDSRAVVGTDDAAHLPGDVRGIALVRRGGDHRPQRVRVALSSSEDVATVAGVDHGPAPRRPWLPELPRTVALSEVLAATPAIAGRFAVGLADEPAHQRQGVASIDVSDRGLLVVGGPGSGKSAALDTIAAQSLHVVRVPSTGEGTWDAVAALVASPPPPGTIVVVDDLDTIASRLTPDHAHVVLERLERLFREAGRSGVLIVASAQRPTGAAARLGELLPRRLVLSTASRADHLAAGGDAAQYSIDAPAGRGHLDRVAVQVALADEGARDAGLVVRQREWSPAAPLTGVVVRRRAAMRAALDRWAERGIRSFSIDEYTAEPAVTADGPVVVVGDPDEWQREWRLLASVRADHDLVVDTSCAAEYRVLTASRDLPPYAEPGAGRAWWHAAGGDPVRIVLPSADVRPDRRS